MFKVEFVCPACKKETTIEQVASGSFTSQLETIMETGENTQGDLEISEGFVKRFQCFQCGFVLKHGDETIVNPEDLYSWLEENSMLGEEAKWDDMPRGYAVAVVTDLIKTPALTPEQQRAIKVLTGLGE